MQWLSPAKLNLYLAITGIRDTDGFHELDSLVAILNFGDRLSVTPSKTDSDVFECNDGRLIWSADNLVRKAVEVYREKTDFDLPLRIVLEKRIPFGAGLGGGSSNASTLLKALNSMNPNPLGVEELQSLSAQIGSDCPLFFGKSMSRMRGRGERISGVPEAFQRAFEDQTFLVFHPGFAVSAAWAYRKLRSGYPRGYTDPKLANTEIEACFQKPEKWKQQWRNDLQPVVERKYLAIGALRSELEQDQGERMMMSGSGSACFCISNDAEVVQNTIQRVKDSWGHNCFIEKPRLLVEAR